MFETLGHINLMLAWLWIVLGALLGLTLGSFFHREGWLGGYGTQRRRLYRLAHVSFFGLARLNLLFYLTARILENPTPWLQVASWGFVVGAFSMPTCCFLMAHFPRLRPLFAIPVGGVLLGGVLTLREVVLL
jgi:hypothetical protein